MGKALALVYGVAAYGFFFLTFLYAIGFVGNMIVPKTIDSGEEGPFLTSLLINVILLGLFAVQHSVMARPAFKAWWTKMVPEPVERSTYVLFASLLLALLCWQWRPMPAEVWSVTDPSGILIVQIIFFLGWGVLLASTFMIDHFDLFGLRQVFIFATGKTRGDLEFKTTGFYRHVRHPIMLGFIIAFWAAPVMSVGHLVFTVGTTAYIFIGIAFEERDLLVALGEPYRAYKMKVSMIIPMPGKKSSQGVGPETRN